MHLRTPSKLTRSLLLAMLGFGVAASPASAQSPSPRTAGQATEIRAVLELFTSQGCSSCPPADALLGQYAERSDVIALSYPVDYWDYLGWKDTLAKPQFTARQKYYAKTRGDGRIYTPQMIVNGRVHAIGSSASSIDNAIEATAPELAATRVPVTIRMEGKHIVVEVGAAPPGAAVEEATIWLATVHRQFDVKIERGENLGKLVKYINVVRNLNPIGVWMGKPDSLQISREAISEPGNEMCVVLLQVGKAGPIVGAASFTGL